MEHSGGRKALVAQLDLGLAAQGRANKGAVALFCQLVSDQRAVGAMIQSNFDAELLGNTDGGQDIVGPVCMGLQGDLTLHNGDHRLQLHVKAGILARFLVFQITLGLEQQFPQ